MADYLQTILFIGIYVTVVGIISPERFLTLSWENLDLKIKPLIAYIYLRGRVYSFVNLLFFKPSSCNGPESEIKWKTDTENPYNFAIYNIQTFGT